MAAWSVFMPDVLVHVPKAPDPLVHNALRAAAREFCGRTRAWRVWVSCTEASGVYTFTLPAGAQVVRFERATVNGKPLDTIPFTWPEADWRVHGSLLDQGVISDDLATFRVTGQPVTGTLQAQVSLMPTRVASGVGDFVAERYLEGIAAGAAARLMSTKGADWYAPADSQLLRGAFDDAVSSACVDMARGHTGRLSSPRPIWC